MPGQHIDRDARAALTGMTSVQRDEYILQLKAKGWSQRQIARYLGMSQPGVLQALKRLQGRERHQIKYAPCDDCGLNFPKTQIHDGLCPACHQGIE